MESSVGREKMTPVPTIARLQWDLEAGVRARWGLARVGRRVRSRDPRLRTRSLATSHRWGGLSPGLGVQRSAESLML